MTAVVRASRTKAARAANINTQYLLLRFAHDVAVGGVCQGVHGHKQTERLTQGRSYIEGTGGDRGSQYPG